MTFVDTPKREMGAIFPLGNIMMTPRAADALGAAGQRPGDFLRRHVSGDWGILCDQDRRANDESLHRDLRLLSAYQTSGEDWIWIITEHDRSMTTILLPSEY